MGAPVVELNGAVTVANGFPTLAGVDLVVDAGEILVVRGANGTGKTSLLRLCAGLVPLARGAARVCGVDLSTDRRGVRPHVGLLGHTNGLYHDLSAAENIAFWASTVGASAAEITDATRRCGLSERVLSTRVRALSAGQRRRTALAALIVRRARLWLLDEPHAGLDAAARDDLDATLRGAAAAGATVVVASHEVDRVGRLATRTIELVGGQVAR